MLEPILKGLVEWLYEMMLDIMSYASGELLGVMSMDLSYFEKTAPIISDIVNVFIALGWALLIGNLVFQSLKAIVSGAGFEAEDPKILFLRTFFFAFLLLASRQICDIGSSITGTVIDMLALPSSITVTMPDESMFSLGGGAKWLLVIIVGVVLMVQMVKLLFEIGERYVITSVLTFFAPLAFSMGGSKNTNDIFKGWCRMYGSMLVMMIMNIVFLKLIMSAMSQMAAGGVLIWLVFVVALTRVARKIDSHIGKIGLNPAQTGSGIGSRIPGAMTMVAIRTMGSLVSRSAANAKGGSGGKSGRDGNSSGRGNNPNPKAPRPGGGYAGSTTSNTGGSTNVNTGGGTNTYTGGTGVNVNRGGSNTTVGGANTNSTNVGGNANKGQQTGNVPNAGGQTNNFGGGNTPRPHNNPNAVPTGRNGGPTVNKGINQNGNQSTQTNVNQGGTVSAKPPIPRNTAGKYPPGVNPMSSVVKGSSPAQGNPDVPNAAGAVHKNRSNVNAANPAVYSPAVQNGMHQNISASSRQNGGKTVVDSDTVHNRSDVKGRALHGGNAAGGNVSRGDSYGTQIGGNSEGVRITGSNVDGSTQNHSEHIQSEHFADKSAEYFRERNRSEFTQMQGRTETTEKRVNHEYKHGRYNPAAANKKVKKSYYQKEDLQQRYSQNHSRVMKRGENNRKQRKK